jgi:hypothetical protein
MQVILAVCEAIYFSRGGWTGSLGLCPTGKSAIPASDLF